MCEILRGACLRLLKRPCSEQGHKELLKSDRQCPPKLHKGEGRQGCEQEHAYRRGNTFPMALSPRKAFISDPDVSSRKFYACFFFATFFSSLFYVLKPESLTVSHVCSWWLGIHLSLLFNSGTCWTINEE